MGTVHGYSYSIHLLSPWKTGQWYGMTSTGLSSGKWESSGSWNCVRSSLELWMISKNQQYHIYLVLFLIALSAVEIPPPESLKCLMMPSASQGTDQECDFSMVHVRLKLISRHGSDQRLQLISSNNSSILEMRDTIWKKIYYQQRSREKHTLSSSTMSMVQKMIHKIKS